MSPGGDLALARATGDLARLEAERRDGPSGLVFGSPARIAAHVVAGVAAAAAVCLLADDRTRGAGVRDLGIALALVLAGGLSSAGEERYPDAVDRDVARAARRFSPLAIGLVLAVLSVFPNVVAWPGLRILGAAGIVLGFFLHVPRVRAIHAFTSGAIVVAAAAIEPRAGPFLALWAAAFAALCALEREEEARQAAGLRERGKVALPLALALGTVLAGGGLFGLATFLLPALPARLPPITGRVPRPFATPPPVPDLTRGIPVVELALILLGLASLLVVYHFLAERREAGKGEALDEDELALPPSSALDPAPQDVDAAVEAVAEGPRRSIVRRYLRHLERLRRGGLPRPPSATPRELARFCEKRVTGDRKELPAQVADAFGRARWAEDEPAARDATAFDASVDALETEL